MAARSVAASVGEASALGYGGGAEFGELGVLDGEGGGLLFAAEFFSCGGGELLVELLNALILAVVEAGGLLEVGGGVAAALFEACERGRGCSCGLLELFAPAAELIELLLQVCEAGFEGGALVLEGCGLLLAAGDEIGLLVAGVAVALAGESPVLQAALDACDLGLHLAESRAGVGGLALGVAALVGLAFDGGVEGGDLMLKVGGARSVWASSCSAFSTFCWTSASSRLRASGPCARGRPPVTVTLWKVSPEGERKKACGFERASERAV